MTQCFKIKIVQEILLQCNLLIDALFLMSAGKLFKSFGQSIRKFLLIYIIAYGDLITEAL